jgi:phosphatidylglycerophosphate synthase
MPSNVPNGSWRTKPTDRFVLKWIKLNLSARVTPRLAGLPWLRPWMITVTATVIGICAGLSLASGWGFIAGLLAAAAQVLDGVDGQFARLTGRESRAGAFLDSVLDRYSDGFLVIGLIMFNAQMGFSAWWLITLGALALIGSGLISYSSARGENLAISFGSSTLASKGTRTTVIIISAILSPVLHLMPFVALCWLVLHTNVVVLCRIGMAFRQAGTK